MVTRVRSLEDLARVGAERSGQTVEDVRGAWGADVAHEAPRFNAAERKAHERKIRERAEPLPLPPAAAAAMRARSPAFCRRDRARAADEQTKARREAFRHRSMARGLPDYRPEDWTGGAFSRSREAFASPRGALAVLSRMPRCYAQRVERAALAMMRTPDGRRVPTRSWDHITARRIVGVAAAMLYESRSTSRNGMARVLRGFTRGSWGALFRNPQTRRPYCVETFFATSHHRREGDPWDCGDVVALVRARAFWKVQPPASTQPARYVGKDRHGCRRALNQYWITPRSVSELVEHVEAIDYDHDEAHAPAWIVEPAEPRPPP